MRRTEFFSDHAADYARYRPRYPVELIEILASRCQRRRLAWDCATGNGQVAEALAHYFERLVASDRSPEQISQAKRSPVSYFCSSAEDSALTSASVDLITVAQAVHWFDLDRFFAEAGRVLAPAGVIAVGTYSRLRIGPEVDRVIARLYRQVVGQYWPPERRWVEDGYRSLPFPFVEESMPEFTMETLWSVDELLGYLATWSACRRFVAATGEDPLQQVMGELSKAWGSVDAKRVVRWPLHLRVGRNE